MPERARLAEVAVDAVDVRVALARLAEHERALEVLVDRRGEPLDLLGREIGRELEGRELREPEDLVRVRAADARERPLVAQERMELAPLAAEDLAEPLGAEAERLGPEVRELRLEPLRREQPDAGALLLARLGEHQLAAVREREPEHRRLRRLRPGRVVAQPPGAHQVHAEDELAVLGREEQVLATALASPRTSAPRARRAAGRTSSRSRCGTGPARATGDCETSGSSSRTHASTSGSSGIST